MKYHKEEKTAAIYLTEKELSELLGGLPHCHRLRPYFQEAGKNIFNW